MWQSDCHQTAQAQLANTAVCICLTLTNQPKTADIGKPKRCIVIEMKNHMSVFFLWVISRWYKQTACHSQMQNDRIAVFKLQSEEFSPACHGRNSLPDKSIAKFICCPATSGRLTVTDVITEPFICGANTRLIVSTSGHSGIVLLLLKAVFLKVSSAMRIIKIIKTARYTGRMPKPI